MRQTTRGFWAEDGSIVRNILLLLIFFGLACVSVRADDAPRQQPSEAAMTFVGGFSDLHFAGMLQRIGARQPKIVAASTLNAGLLAAIFEAEIAKVVRIRGPEWQRNMALAWMPLLSDEEMASLAAAGAQSPHVEKYLSNRNSAGETMQGLSSDLFKQALDEVVTNTLQQLGEQ